MALPAFAAERRAAAMCCGAIAAGRPAPPLSIDISYPHGAQQQTRRTPLLRSNDRIDPRTPDRYMDLAAHTMWAVTINSARCRPAADTVWMMV